MQMTKEELLKKYPPKLCIDYIRLLSKYPSLRRTPTSDSLEARRIVWLEVICINVSMDGTVSIEAAISKAAPKTNLGIRTFSSQEELEQTLDVLLGCTIKT
jgi:hypothetical protein